MDLAPLPGLTMRCCLHMRKAHPSTFPGGLLRLELPFSLMACCSPVSRPEFCPSWMSEGLGGSDDPPAYPYALCPVHSALPQCLPGGPWAMPHCTVYSWADGSGTVTPIAGLARSDGGSPAFLVRILC